MAQASIAHVISHWSKLLGGVQHSPKEFYEALQQAIDKREVPGITISPMYWPEAGATSPRREYMRLQREPHVIDVCAAPFGSGFFVSEWLSAPLKVSPVAVVCMIAFAAAFLWSLSNEGAQTLYRLTGGNLWTLRQALVLGFFIAGLVGVIRPLYYPPRPTFYRIDTGLMFQKAVHEAVLEVIDQITTAKGFRGLTELERQPILREFYMR